MERPPITPNMRISDLVARHPETLRVLHRYGIRCEDCHASRYESIGQGARVHALDLELLLTELNNAAENRVLPPNRPLRMARSQPHV
jgi:hybrid cluster-associated redox disulfide protein